MQRDATIETIKGGKLIEGAAVSTTGFGPGALLEKAFAVVFRGLVYPQIWEDPVCDMEGLAIGEDDHVVAIASGGSRMVVEKTLHIVGISDWFDEVVTADDVTDGKPAPDIFLKAAKLLGVNPLNCLALDDAPAGILAAQRAGMQVISIPSPLSSPVI